MTTPYVFAKPTDRWIHGDFHRLPLCPRPWSYESRHASTLLFAPVAYVFAQEVESPSKLGLETFNKDFDLRSSTLPEIYQATVDLLGVPSKNPGYTLGTSSFAI